MGLEACNQAGHVARQRWELTAHALANDKGQVLWERVRGGIEELGDEWNRATQVLDVLATCARATVDLLDIIELMDQDHDGCVTADEFGTAIHALVGRRLNAHEVRVLYEALAELDSSGRLTHEGIARGLEIVDSWDDGHQDLENRVSTLTSGD